MKQQKQYRSYPHHLLQLDQLLAVLLQMAGQQMGQCVSSHLHIKGRPIMNVFCRMHKHFGVQPPKAMMLIFFGDTALVRLQSKDQNNLLKIAKHIFTSKLICFY